MNTFFARLSQTMHTTTLIDLALAAILIAGAPLALHSPAIRSAEYPAAGFMNPTIGYSQGGYAICVIGLVAVAASTDGNVRLNVSSSLTIEQSTQLVLNLDTVDAGSFIGAVTGRKQRVDGIWNISSKLCWPMNWSPDRLTTASQIQLLTHGVVFDKSYWDFPGPERSSNRTEIGDNKYSYVDFAAQNDRVTFSYDRLGVGNSSHPDPVQVVQGPLEIEILHSISDMLRSGSIGDIAFEQIIGVGHSYGSALTAAVAREYPNNFDAVVLTGFSNDTSGSTQFVSSLNLLPQSLFETSFAGLATGYLIPTTRYGVQYAFFSYPDFDTQVLTEAFETIATTTVGEQLTMQLIAGIAANFTRPVYVLDGQGDLFFCDGDCGLVNGQGQDIPAATISELFPVADKGLSSSYVLEGAGHGVNLASNADTAFDKIQEWITRL